MVDQEQMSTGYSPRWIRYYDFYSSFRADLQTSLVKILTGLNWIVFKHDFQNIPEAVLRFLGLGETCLKPPSLVKFATSPSILVIVLCQS